MSEWIRINSVLNKEIKKESVNWYLSLVLIFLLFPFLFFFCPFSLQIFLSVIVPLFSPSRTNYIVMTRREKRERIVHYKSQIFYALFLYFLFYAFLNILILVIFKSLSVNGNFWIHSKFVSIVGFFFFLSQIIINIFKNIEEKVNNMKAKREYFTWVSESNGIKILVWYVKAWNA